MSNAPVLELRESNLSYNDARQPMTLRVFEDRVECTRPGIITRGSTDTIRYHQVAQVIVHRGLMWSALAVETNGGGGFRIGGLKKDAADQAKRAIDERVARPASGPSHAAATSSAPDLADQLARLGELRQSGALTPEEFAAAKAKLLS
jgi:Short C-terminal domain